MITFFTAIAVEFIRTLRDLGAFRRSPGVYRRFFEDANAMFLIFNSKGFIIDINKEFAERLGYERKDLVKTRLMRYVHPQDQQSVLIELNKIREGASISGFRSRYICSNDEVVTLEWNSTGNGIMYVVAIEVKDNGQESATG